MNEKWGVAGLCGLAFIGLFLKTAFFANDSFASWACVANGWCETLAWQPGAVFLFELFPANIIFVKFVMLFCFILAMLACFSLVKRFFSEETAFLAILFGLVVSPVIIFEFSKFENEIFALPLIFWGIYFLFDSKVKNKVIGLLLVGASWLFWLFPGYLFIRQVQFFPLILELTLFSGLFGFFVGIFFIPFIFLVENRQLKWFALVGIFLMFFSSKLAVLFIPFLFIGIAQAIELLGWCNGEE